MNRRLALLFLLVLGSLSLSANQQIEPDRRYQAVFVMDKPQDLADNLWQEFASASREIRIPGVQYTHQGNQLYMTKAETIGRYISKTLQETVPIHASRIGGRWQLREAKLLPPTPGEEAAENIKRIKAEQEKEKAMQKLADENDPRRTLDAKGKPIYNAGSPEAEAQLRESAKEQDKSAAKFKQYNKWSTNGPVTGEGLTGKPVNNTGAFDEDEPAARPAPAPTSKFAKPQPQQGTKKDDTLFKNQNQNQNSAGQFRAPDNFIAIWAHPQDPGAAKEDDRLVLVELTGSPKPVGLTLWQAKDRGYVPKNFKYSSLRVFPQ